MNICMIAYTFYENDNRVKRYAETLADSGHNVDIIALRKKSEPFVVKSQNINIYKIQFRRINEKSKYEYLFKILLFLFWSFFFVSILGLIRRYRIVHVHSVPDFEVFAALVPKLLGAKIILDVHDIVPEFFKNKFKSQNSDLYYTMLLYLEKLSCQFSDHVIISNDIWHTKLLNRSTISQKLTTIINYPDLDLFSVTEKTDSTKRYYILYPGTVSYHQGLDIAIKGFYRIHHKFPKLDFYIYGEGPARKEIELLAMELDLQERVQIYDFVPIDKIADIMNNALIGIIPKRNDDFGGEAFSTKSLEFMALKVPILISRTKIDSFYYDSNIVQFFEPGNPIDFASKLSDLLESDSIRNELAENAFKFVSHCNWQQNQYLYTKIIDNLLD